MMTLADASAYFDQTPVFDPYSGDALFLAQIEPFEDSKRDTSSAFRRILSVAPGVALPDHRTVRIFGNDWILGHEEADGMAELHRRKFVMASATTRLKVSNLAQYLAGQHAMEVLASPHWVKDAKQLEVSSDLPQMFDVYIAAAPAPKSILWDSSTAYLVASARPLSSGILSAYSLKLDSPVQIMTISTRAYSHVLGEFQVLSSPEVRGQLVRWQSLFDYGSQAEARYQEGDVSIILPPDPKLDTSSLVKVGALSYQVLAVDRVGGAQVAHGRRI